MKRAIIAAALILTGCSNNGDPSVCTPILDPRSASSIEDGIQLQRDPSWQLARAEACVHRQAYRLATSPDPAPTVAEAVVVFCEGPIQATADVSAYSEQGKEAIRMPTQETMDIINARIAQIKTNFESYALSKVVEGRAGKCKATPAS